MGKRIVLCFDGTWNTPADPGSAAKRRGKAEPGTFDEVDDQAGVETNVCRLYRSVRRVALEGVTGGDDQIRQLTDLAQSHAPGVDAYGDLGSAAPFPAKPIVELAQRPFDVRGRHQRGARCSIQVSGQSEQRENAVVLHIADGAPGAADRMTSTLGIALERKQRVMRHVVARQCLAVGEVAKQQNDVSFAVESWPLHPVDRTFRQHQQRYPYIALWPNLAAQPHIGLGSDPFQCGALIGRWFGTKLGTARHADSTGRAPRPPAAARCVRNVKGAARLQYRPSAWHMNAAVRVSYRHQSPPPPFHDVAHLARRKRRADETDIDPQYSILPPFHGGLRCLRFGAYLYRVPGPVWFRQPGDVPRHRDEAERRQHRYQQGNREQDELEPPPQCAVSEGVI